MFKVSSCKANAGEWYVVVQAVLFLLVVFGPRTWRGFRRGGHHIRSLVARQAVFCCWQVSLLASAGALNLGKNLTPLPCPKDDATLVTTGAYRFVRHPIYSGIIFMAFGWSLWVHGWLTIGYAILVFVLLDAKSHREELWLKKKFPEYTAYQKRVRKLIPFLY